jgi:hypothetical protein
MVLNHRKFFSLIVKKTFHFVCIFLFLLPLLSCGFYKPKIVKTDFSTREIKASALGFINEDDIFSAVALINVFKHNSFYPVKVALIIKRPSYLRLELIPIIYSFKGRILQRTTDSFQFEKVSSMADRN